jgi:capsid portal protein
MTSEKSLSTKEKPEEELGEVFHIQKKRGILKASDPRRSAQLKEEKYLKAHGLIPHPFAVSSLMLLQENCSFFDACVRQIAVDVVGQGWTVKASEESESDQDKKKKSEIVNFLKDPNDTDEDIADIIEKVIIDIGTVGWYGIEVSKEGDTVNGLWQVPAHTIWVHESKEKYCQIRGTKKMWFRDYGSDMPLSSKTGGEVKSNTAHELIYGRRYYQASDYYGAPPILPAVGGVQGLIGIRDYNLAFFENYGVPASLLVLEGRWKEGSARKITNFLDTEIKGSSNAHKTLVLKPPPEGKVDWKKIQEAIDEAGFKVYLKILRDEVLVCYKMPPYRIGIAELGSLGGSTAVEMTRIYAASIIQPLKRQTARMITKKVIEQGLAGEGFEFEWGELDIRDYDAMVKRFHILVSIGAMTPNEARVELGKKPYDGGDQHYVQSNYVPVGEETVRKMRDTLEASIAEVVRTLDIKDEEQRKLIEGMIPRE